MGVSPNELNKMSLYEVLSTYFELKKLDGSTNEEQTMTQDRIDQLKKRWSNLKLKDVKV